MKFCAICGKQNEDENDFCENCGNPIQTNQQPPSNQQQVYSQPIYQSAQPNYYVPSPQPKPILSQNPVLNKIKTMVTSPLFLVAVIIYSAFVLFSLIQSFMPSSLMSMLYKNSGMLSGMGIGVFGSVLNMIQGVFTAVAIIALIPSILICVGLWMFFVSSSTPENRSTSGLTMIKVSTIINLVGMLLVPVIAIIVFLIAAAGSASSGYSNSGNIVGVMFLAIFIILIAITLPVLIYVNIIKTLNAVRNMIFTLVPTNKISMFLVVMNFISAGIGLISGIISGDIMTIFSSLLSAGFLVLISICLINFKKEMEMLIYPNNYGVSQPTQQTTFYNNQQPL